MSSVCQLAAAEALTAATFLSGEGKSEARLRRSGGRGPVAGVRVRLSAFGLWFLKRPGC